MHNFNISLFQWIYNFSGNHEVFDGVVVFFTKYLAYGMIAIVAFYLLYLFALGAKEPIMRLRRFGQGIEVAVSLFVTWGVVSILKGIVSYPRPFILLSDIEPLVRAVPYESFPSAHSALTMALATAVFFNHKTLGKFLVVFSILVALSRIYVGVHYPVDVLAGLLVGFLIAWGVHRVFARD